ncbi:MAG: hypothetical protein JXA18_15125 [Chitinispirillaceae bacterium]|nr:hypothetical protein [Chitinispirillaceae bacterium]
MKHAYILCMATIAVFAAGLFTTQAKTYHLTVQADRQTQQWNRFYEKGVATCHQYTLIDSYWKRGIGKALKFGHDSAGFHYWRGHGILHDDVGLVKAATAASLTLDWTNFDKVYDTGRAVGMYPMCEISTTPAALAQDPSNKVSASYNNNSPIKSPPTKYGWNQWMALMDSIVRHVEERYGVDEIRNKWYFEVWNEPNWWYASFNEYLTLYIYTAAALKRADPQIRVGGPACQGNYTFTNEAEIANLLNHCRSTKNPVTQETGIPIDFISWHVYSDNPLEVNGINGFLLNPNTAVTVHRMMLDNLRTSEFSWFKGPSMNNETGPSSRVPVQRDLHQSASWLARTIHLLNEGGPEYPPPDMFGYWAISDIYQEGMNNTSNISFQEGNYGMMVRGTPDYPPSWDIPKPVFQAYRMLHKLGNYELSASGGIPTDPYKIDDGVGIIATASREGNRNDSIQMLVYNHIASSTQNSAPKDSVILTVENIPWTGDVRVQHLALDTVRSNTYTKWRSLGRPARPSNAQWDELRQAGELAHYSPETTTSLTGSTFTMAFSQNYFSVHLITLSNPNALPVKKPVVESAIAKSNALRANVHEGAVMLEIRGTEQYTVNVYTTAGRNIFTTSAKGPGNTRISVSGMPAGAFVLECRNANGSLVKQLVLTR